MKSEHRKVCSAESMPTLALDLVPMLPLTPFAGSGASELNQEKETIQFDDLDLDKPYMVTLCDGVRVLGHWQGFEKRHGNSCTLWKCKDGSVVALINAEIDCIA